MGIRCWWCGGMGMGWCFGVCRFCGGWGLRCLLMLFFLRVC